MSPKTKGISVRDSGAYRNAQAVAIDALLDWKTEEGEGIVRRGMLRE
jgi:hypothetical protein